MSKVINSAAWPVQTAPSGPVLASVGSIYAIFHRVITKLVNTLGTLGIKPLGALIGMVLFEPITLIKVFFRSIQLRKDPSLYGFNFAKLSKNTLLQENFLNQERFL